MLSKSVLKRIGVFLIMLTTLPENSLQCQLVSISSCPFEKKQRAPSRGNTVSVKYQTPVEETRELKLLNANTRTHMLEKSTTIY